MNDKISELMKCPNCEVEMVEGVAIDPGYEGNCRYLCLQPPLLNAETINIISCLKCPKCGFSDEPLIEEYKRKDEQQD